MSEINVEIDTGMVRAIPVSSTFEPAPTGLAAAPVVGGGTFAANTYYWVVTGLDAAGETTASNEATAVIALNGSANLTWNALPAGTTGVNVYRGTAPGGENALIVTLGAVTAYVDTGTAGTAKTPPTSNTAEIASQLIYSGLSFICGYALTETSGTAAVKLSIKSQGQLIVPITIAQGVTDKAWFGPEGIRCRGGVLVVPGSGVFSGVVWVKYDRWG